MKHLFAIEVKTTYGFYTEIFFYIGSETRAKNYFCKTRHEQPQNVKAQTLKRYIKNLKHKKNAKNL